MDEIFRVFMVRVANLYKVAVAPCSYSFVRMCGSEKNRVDLDVPKQYTLFVLRRLRTNGA